MIFTRWGKILKAARLQWVHGPRTVVMVVCLDAFEFLAKWLQWVHGPRTVVMVEDDLARMAARGFNGSTVRGPW